MFERNSLKYDKGELFGRPCIIASGLGEYDLTDTMECGQCFRHLRLVGSGDFAYTEDKEELSSLRDGASFDEGYCEYFTVVGELAVRVGQKRRGELIFFGLKDGDIPLVEDFFSLRRDFDKVRESIKTRALSQTLKDFADKASGVTILSQDCWETVFSFIISQNNNIPRIRKIIRKICLEYGENLAEREDFSECPLTCSQPDFERCRECGRCYTFPRAEDIMKAPERLLSSKPGFRYRYLRSCAELVSSGSLDFKKIKERGSLEFTLAELKRIVGVGDKVASCCALFAFGNYDAFPIDVWIKRAIEKYFDGNLDIESFREYAGIAQQYIFHSVRNLEEGK